MKYLGIVLLFLSSYVMAEEVYYCSDNTRGVTGFSKKDGQYKQTNFYAEKFKMKLQDDGNIAIHEDGDKYSFTYLCSTPFQGGPGNLKHKNNKSCVHEYHNGKHFNFNQDNGKYVLVYGSGYVFYDSDDVITHIGTCTKF
jgi:hypothetical protein